MRDEGLVCVESLQDTNTFLPFKNSALRSITSTSVEKIDFLIKMKKLDSQKACTHHTHTYTQSEREREREREGETDRQTYRRTDGRTDGRTDRQTDR